MAAPSAGPPLAVTVGALWRFRLEPRPPSPPRLTVEVTVARVVVALIRVIFGVVYFKDCPQQPNIPNYLLGLALVTLLLVLFMTSPSESGVYHSREHPSCCNACVVLLVSLSGFILVLAGDVWIFSVYQPNYDPTAADGLYCSKTLYTFAFWNAVWETSALFYTLASLCAGLVCYVVVRPAPPNRDFYSHV